MHDLSIDEHGCVALSGQLTVDEVPQVYRKSLAWREIDELPTIVDLQSVEATDSSAVALLLEWADWACHAGRRIEFRNPPEALRTIAGLSSIQSLLGWDQPEEVHE